jgi:pyruvate-formate lyase-activating enzyme
VSVSSHNEGTQVTVTGGLPAPDLEALRQALAESGHADLHVTVVFVPSQRVEI